MGPVLRNADKLICVAIFVAMTGLGFANVVVRYLTDYSFAASEELLTNGFLLLTVFGAAVAARSGDHLAVTIVYDHVGPGLRKLLLLVAGALAIVLLASSVWFSWQLFSNQLTSGVRSYALQVPAWYYSAALPFGFALVLVRYVQHARAMWQDLSPKGRDHA